MKFHSIDEYIAGLDNNGSKAVRAFRTFMKNEFPEVTPQICFAMLMWWAGAKMYNGYVAVSAAKKHFSIHFHDENYLSKLKTALPHCTFGKRCIHVKYGDDNSTIIVKQHVVKYFGMLLCTER